MTNPFVQLIQLNDDEIKEIFPDARLNYIRRYPDEVLRSALDNHARFKSFVSLGSSRPLGNSVGVGMARLQFGDGEYTRIAQEMQRLHNSAKLRADALREIEEPVPVTRTLLRTPGVNQQASLRQSCANSGTASTPTPGFPSNAVSMNTAYTSPLSSQRGYVTFKEAGPNLAAILAVTEGHNSVGEAADTWPSLEPSRASVTDADSGGNRDLRAAWPRHSSRRNVGLHGYCAATAAGAPSASGEPDAVDGSDCCGGGGGGVPQHRPSLPPPELASLMIAQQQLQQLLLLQPPPPQSTPCAIGSLPKGLLREVTVADRRTPRPPTQLQLQPMQRPPHSQGLAPPPLSRLQPPPLPQPQLVGSLSSPSTSQTGYLGSSQLNISDYLRGGGGGGATAAGAGLPQQLQPHHSAPPPCPMLFANGAICEDLPTRKRGAITRTYGNPPPPLQTVAIPRLSDPTGEPDSQGVQRLSIGRATFRYRGSIKHNGSDGDGRYSSDAGEPDGVVVVSTASADCSGPSDSDGGASSPIQPSQEATLPRSMTAADIAVISEAARRYFSGPPHEQQEQHQRQQRASADGSTTPSTSTPLALARFSSMRRTTLDPHPSATSSGLHFPTAAAAAVPTERADGLLKALRAPDSYASGGSGDGGCDIPQSAADVPTTSGGGELQLVPRPPATTQLLVAAGRGGSFKRSSSIRSRGPRPGDATAEAGAGGDEEPDQRRISASGVKGIGVAGSSSRRRRVTLCTPLQEGEDDDDEPHSPNSIPPDLIISSMPSLDAGTCNGNRAGSPSTTAAAAAVSRASGDGLSGSGEGPMERRGSEAGSCNVARGPGVTRSGTALKGWSSKKEISTTGPLGRRIPERRRRSTTDRVLENADSESDGASSMEEQQQKDQPWHREFLGRPVTTMGRFSSDHVGGRTGSTKAALRAAVDRISQQLLADAAASGGRRGKRGEDDSDHDGTGAGSGNSQSATGGFGGAGSMDVSPAIEGLLRTGGFRSDVRDLFKAGSKFMVIRRFKHAEKIAASAKLKEKGWRKA